MSIIDRVLNIFHEVPWRQGAKFAFDWFMRRKFWVKVLIITAFTGMVFGLMAWVGSEVLGFSAAATFNNMTNPSLADEPRGEGVGDLFWDGWFVALVNLFGILMFNGVFVTLLINGIFGRQADYTRGVLRYHALKKRHFKAIIGGHAMVPKLVSDLMSAPDAPQYLLIQTRRDPEELRAKIISAMTAQVKKRFPTGRKLMDRVIIYAGDRTARHELEDLYLTSARAVYIIGEDTDLDGRNHDALNMECWEIVSSLGTASAGQEKIPCQIMFEYQATFNAFQFTDVAVGPDSLFDFMPFSIYSSWAQKVLVQAPGRDYGYKPLDTLEVHSSRGDNASHIGEDSLQRVHLIVVGMSKMGMALAIEAAHMCHYPNFNNPKAGRPRTLITFIDRNARREMRYLTGRYKALFHLARWRFVRAPQEEFEPRGSQSWRIYNSSAQITAAMNAGERERAAQLYPWFNPLEDPSLQSEYDADYLGHDFVDIDFEFIEGDLATPSIQRYISEACADRAESHSRGASITTLALCLPLANEALSAALYLPENVYKDALQILVQQDRSGALVDAIRSDVKAKRNRYGSLRPFGMLNECDYLGLDTLRLAKMVHSIYTYEQVDGKGPLTVHDVVKPAIDKCAATGQPLPAGVESLIESTWKRMDNDGGKSRMAKQWSNFYCANSFYTKMRSCPRGMETTQGDLTPELILALGKTEHNRWVVEQMLMGMRPVDNRVRATLKDPTLPVRDKEDKSNLKKAGIHSNIASNENIGGDAHVDTDIVSIIPYALTQVHNPDSGFANSNPDLSAPQTCVDACES